MEEAATVNYPVQHLCCNFWNSFRHLGAQAVELPLHKDGDLELTLTFSHEEQGEQDASNVFKQTHKQTNSLADKI